VESMRKKIYPLGFFFSVFFFGYRGACTGTARLCSKGTRSALSTSDRGGLSEPPLFLQTNPRKKRYLLLGSTNNPTSSVAWAGAMLANPSIKASWAMHPRANVLKRNQRGDITKSKEI